MEQSEVIKRIKTTQNIVFWVLMWLAFYYLLVNKKRDEITVLVLVFFFALSYFMTSFYFIRLGGYVGNDIALRLSSLYKEYQTPIRKFMKIVGWILLLLLIILLLLYLPDNNIGNRMYGLLVAVVGTVIGGLFIYYLNKKQNKE